MEEFYIRYNIYELDNGKHHKPHVHVYYGEYKASVGLDGIVLEGSLPAKQYRILAGWMAIHEDELYAAWNNAVRSIPFEWIEPLHWEAAMYLKEGIVYGEGSIPKIV